MIVDYVFDPPQASEAALSMSERETPFILEEEKTEGDTGAGSNAADKCIAVHCVSGLANSPFLVALAIIYKGCKPEKAL